MNILMLTNTFTPHVGGVARSVEGFAGAYRAQGHRVLVVAPIFENVADSGPEVIRVPALQHFNGSDFSVVLPIPGYLNAKVAAFSPDVVHAHHPFLLGSTAMRLAQMEQVPLVFTHHTMYEQYTHYVPGDCSAMQRFVVHLSTNYANLCDAVFAPSESVAKVLAERGVTVPVHVVPTGVDTERFATGDGAGFRRRLGIGPEAFVVGHVGRLAPEKNLPYLARAVCQFLSGKNGGNRHFLLAGEGPSLDEICRIFDQAGVRDRMHKIGVMPHKELADAYHAMDVFAFASQSETQGMVLTEAMAAGVPVVAVDAPGVREVVTDKQNGRLLHTQEIDTFADALDWIARQPPEARQTLQTCAIATADRFSMARTARTALGHYHDLKRRPDPERNAPLDAWRTAVRLIQLEWEMVKGVAAAAEEALTPPATHQGSDHGHPY